MKQKYVRLHAYNSIIIFPEIIQHSDFMGWNVKSAGFCYINTDEKTVKCFGESISLGLKSDEQDSQLATRQLFEND